MQLFHARALRNCVAQLPRTGMPRKLAFRTSKRSARLLPIHLTDKLPFRTLSRSQQAEGIEGVKGIKNGGSKAAV